MTQEQLVKLFDHTNLHPYATPEDMKKLCDEARRYHFAMVAINSVQTELCKELLAGTDVHVGAAISFPLGQTTIETKVFETEDAIRNGADEIVYPEKDLAEKVAVKFSSNHLVDYFALSKDVALYEIYVPSDWQGKSISELNVRTKYHINILAVRKRDGDLTANPGPDYVFGEREQMVVLGTQTHVRKFIK